MRRLTLALLCLLAGSARAGGFMGGGLATRVHLLTPGAGYFDQLESYGYSGAIPFSLEAYVVAGFRVLPWLDAGGSFRYLAGPVASTSTRLTLNLDEVELGGFLRGHRPLGRFDLGARIEAGVARPWLRLRRQVNGRAAAYGALTLDCFYWATPRWGIEFHLDYTLVDAGRAFAPYPAHPLGGIGAGISVQRRF